MSSPTLTPIHFCVDEQGIPVRIDALDERRSQSTLASAPELDLALSELADLREQLDALREELVWANRLTTLGTMAAVLAHEYNNLLTPIGSYAQLALDNPGDEELTQKALVASAEAISKARAIAAATLDFARPEDTAEQGTHTCRLSDSIQQASEYLKQKFEQDQVALCIDVPECRLAISTVRLQQVFINLLDNARKALKQKTGPRQITISGRREGKSVEFTVRDNGPGIEPDLVDDLFSSFVSRPHVERSTGDDNPGTGLGLRVCKDIIESAGGAIQATSEPGKGAAFQFWLPVED